MKYAIVIEETNTKDFTVEANSPADAYEMAESKYESGEFVLDPDNCYFRQMLLRVLATRALNGENSKPFRLIFFVGGCVFMTSAVIPSQYKMEKQ